MTDWTRCRTAPYAHQKVGVDALLAHPAFALFDQVGGGKTKQVVDAACFLYLRDDIDAVVTVCPGAVRSVWADGDPVLGEVAKHAFLDVGIHEYHRKTPTLPKTPNKLWFVVSNFEFLRRSERLEPLIDWAKRRKVLLVLDESWMVKSYKAQQTKAMMKLRAVCERVVILNGTPGDPGELYSQFAILDKNILGHRSFFSFRARYAKMGGYMSKQIVGWDHMDEFRAKIAPYALRRLTHDCVDLPPVSYTQIDARLTDATWRHYTAMRDELVTWLSQNEVCSAEQAGVRVMRLAQITSGFLGGVQDLEEREPQLCPDGVMRVPSSGTREIGREKLDALLEWLGQHWAGDKALIFTRFRADVERAAEVLQTAYPRVTVRKLYGGQTADERDEAKRLLAPGGDPTPAIVVGNAASGGSGLNFAAACLCVYLGNDFSLKNRQQSEGRTDRPGQTRPVTYLDVIACGPNNERTVDHLIVSALRRKQDLANLTAAAWRQLLEAA